MLVEEGHETELYETAVKQLKALVLIKRDLTTTKKLKACPASEIPGAALFPTELQAAMARTLARGDGHRCWSPGLQCQNPPGSQKLNRERKDSPSQTRND